MITKLKPALRGFVPLGTVLLLSGCSGLDLLDPRGPVGLEERNVLLLEFAIMMCIVVPTIVLTIYYAWKYRASNTSAEYLPNWSHSNKIEVAIWGIPTLIIFVLGIISYDTTHRLDPYRPLSPAVAGTKPALNVEVVALDWKWMFIYPDQGIATINQLAIPTNTQISFRITSDTVMNSFFIPRLGSMIYAMAGMQTQLHLLASQSGDYLGESSQFSGRGFSDMKFRTLAMDDSEFNAWVDKVRASSDTLDSNDYSKYAAPSEAAPVQYFSHVQPGLFEGIIAKYNNGMVIDKSTGKVMHMQSAMSDMQMKE